MIEPTQEQIETRWHQIVDGLGVPYIPELPDIAFRKVTKLDRAICEQIREEKIAELRAEGGYIDILDIPGKMQEWAEERNINLDKVTKDYREYLQRTIKSCPVDLTRPSTKQFSEEEIAGMSDEMKEKYRIEETERISQYLNWVDANITKGERKTRDSLLLIRAKEKELEDWSYQPLASTYSDCAKMILCSIYKSDEKPYFEALDNIELKKNKETRTAISKAIEEWDRLNLTPSAEQTMVRKWKEWVEGRLMDFIGP
jgi:hypothetical protein